MKLSSFSQLSSPQQFKNCCRSVQPAAIKRVFHPNRADDRVLYLITQSKRMSVVQDGRKGSWPELRHNSGVYFDTQNNDDKRVSGTFRTRSGRMRPAARPQNCPFYYVPEHGSYIAQKPCNHRTFRDSRRALRHEKKQTPCIRAQRLL